MKLSAAIIVSLVVLLSSCGHDSTSPKQTDAPIKNESASSTGIASGSTGDKISDVLTSQSGSLESTTGSEDPEVRAIMDDLDNMFESVASEK